MLADGTVEVRRGGTFLTIPANAVDRYMAKGYDVVDSQGNVIKASIPNDVNVLRIAYQKHTAEIAALKKRIEELEAEVAKPVEKEAEKPAETAPKASTRKTKK